LQQCIGRIIEYWQSHTSLSGALEEISIHANPPGNSINTVYRSTGCFTVNCRHLADHTRQAHQEHG
jgi:hypothetical protein